VISGSNPELRVVDKARRKSRGVSENLWVWSLVLGGAIIIGSAVYTSTHLNDKTVYTLLVPGVVLGLVFVALSVVLRRRGDGKENEGGNGAQQCLPTRPGRTNPRIDYERRR
jgi:uncharacterized membrane protein YsdA (DUF1294 family)